MYIAPGQMQTSPWGQNFDDNRKAFSLLYPYAASFKMISSKSDFIHIFNDFIHAYSPEQGQKTPWGQTFDVNRKPLFVYSKFHENIYTYRGIYT